MSQYGALSKFKHFSEFDEPIVGDETGVGVVTPATRRNMAVQNLTGNSSAVAATLGQFGEAAALATGAGTGITAGTGTVYKSAAVKYGDLYYVRIFIDLTGLTGSATDLDIIGVDSSANPAHIGQLAAAEVGATIDAIQMTCLEAPATGSDDIDLYSADESTGVEDALITSLTETALITSGAAWTNGRVVGATAVPAAGEYLYLTNGEAAGGTYTAGKFLIEVYGHD